MAPVIFGLSPSSLLLLLLPLLLLSALPSAVLGSSEIYPKQIPTVHVQCGKDEETLFKCHPDWDNAKGADVWESREARLQRIKDFVKEVKGREEETQEFFSYATGDKALQDYYEEIRGVELYESASTFFGWGEDVTKADFLGISYYLEYHANNTYTVSMNDGEKNPAIGFATGVYNVDENSPYTEAFMDHLRDITVQYAISIVDDPTKDAETPQPEYYAIGYMGTFVLPYFFSGISSDYIKKFSAAYNIEYEWATKYGGTFQKFVDLFKLGSIRVVPPGVFMVNFVAPGYKEVNTYDPLGQHSARKDKEPATEDPIDFDRFKYMFALKYGLRTDVGSTFDNNMFADSADQIDTEARPSPLEGGSWNFCRSLGRNGLGDVRVEDDNEHPYDYFIQPENGEDPTVDCNHNNLPSFFFMTHDLDEHLPFIFSTKYQLMVDGSCQYRTNLDNKGYPKERTASVTFGREYGFELCDVDDTDCQNKREAEYFRDYPDSENEKKEDNLPSNNAFVLNGTDFIALHVMQKNSKHSSYDEKKDGQAPYSYQYYELTEDTLEDLYYDSYSMCNTGISDIYVLYDMKPYSGVYKSIGGITQDSFGHEAVYNAMRAFPTKSNYTSAVTAAWLDKDGNTQVKTELQKCVNVFLDTSGKEIAACNDVTSTWDWGVFGGSLAGIVVVVGLWVWGGLYSSSFKKHNPPYYTDLISYEAEWKRRDEEMKQLKARQKAAKKGMKLVEEQHSSSGSSATDTRN